MMDNNLRNNILSDFEYGFCDLEGNLVERDLDLELAWDEETIELLKEIYPVLGRFSLNQKSDRTLLKIRSMDNDVIEEQNIFDYSCWNRLFGMKNNDLGETIAPLKALMDISEFNDMVIELRRLLYSEIECKNYEIEINTDFNQDIEKVDHFAKWIITNLEGIVEYNSPSIKAELAKVYFLSSNNDEKIKELLDYIQNILKSAERKKDSFSRLKACISCMEAIKNSRLFIDGDTVWKVFLIKLYELALLGSELRTINNYDFYNQDHTPLIKDAYGKIDEGLRTIQNENNRIILNLYSYTSLSARDFLKHDVVKQLYDALNDSSDLFGDYSSSGNGNVAGGEKKRCFAVMYNKDTHKKYAAISGVFDPDKYIDPNQITKKAIQTAYKRKNDYINRVNLLKQILGNAFEVIDSDYDVKYYYKNKRISAKKYMTSVKPYDKNPGNRMFSCCERKLSTKLVHGCEHDLYIKYNPCIMCERMITKETKNIGHFINVFYWKTYNSNLKINYYDKSANEVS